MKKLFIMVFLFSCILLMTGCDNSNTSSKNSYVSCAKELLTSEGFGKYAKEMVCEDVKNNMLVCQYDYSKGHYDVIGFEIRGDKEIRMNYISSYLNDKKNNTNTYSITHQCK